MYDCIFCRIIEGDLPATIIYEDDLAIAFMDIMPVNPGHVLIVPKRHFAELNLMDEETGAHLFKIAMRIERAIRRTDLRCEGTNLLQNNGRAAMQEVAHVHLHVIPRYRGDSLRFGYSRERYEREQLEETATLIRQQLS
jgi:histidine triad (HIT) family protein